MTLETHGRWPLVGAAALIPASVYAVSDERVRPLAALLWHQTEEWVWPGDFLPWINRAVLDYYDDEFPIDRRTGFIVNVGFGWGLTAVAFGERPAPAPAAALYASHVANAGMHIGWAIKQRRIVPGLATAIATLLPTGIIGLHDLVRDEKNSRKQIAAGVAAGVALSAGLAPLMKWKIRRRRRSRPPVMKWYLQNFEWVDESSDAELDRLVDEYRAYLESIQDHLPQDLRNFDGAQSDGTIRTIHDAHLADRIDNTPQSFTLSWVCGTGAPPYDYERLTVEYTGDVELFGPPLHELGSLLDDPRADFIDHELEVLSDGRFEHRHALSNNVEFGIRFSNAEVRSEPATSDEYHDLRDYS